MPQGGKMRKKFILGVAKRNIRPKAVSKYEMRRGIGITRCFRQLYWLETLLLIPIHYGSVPCEGVYSMRKRSSYRENIDNVFYLYLPTNFGQIQEYTLYFRAQRV